MTEIVDRKRKCDDAEILIVKKPYNGSVFEEPVVALEQPVAVVPEIIQTKPSVLVKNAEKELQDGNVQVASQLLEQAIGKEFDAQLDSEFCIFDWIRACVKRSLLLKHYDLAAKSDAEISDITTEVTYDKNGLSSCADVCVDYFRRGEQKFGEYHSAINQFLALQRSVFLDICNATKILSRIALNHEYRGFLWQCQLKCFNVASKWDLIDAVHYRSERKFPGTLFRGYDEFVSDHGRSVLVLYYNIRRVIQEMQQFGDGEFKYYAKTATIWSRLVKMLFFPTAQYNDHLSSDEESIVYRVAFLTVRTYAEWDGFRRFKKQFKTLREYISLAIEKNSYADVWNIDKALTNDTDGGIVTELRSLLVKDSSDVSANEALIKFKLDGLCSPRLTTGRMSRLQSLITVAKASLFFISKEAFAEFLPKLIPFGSEYVSYFTKHYVEVCDKNHSKDEMSARVLEESRKEIASIQRDAQRKSRLSGKSAVEKSVVNAVEKLADENEALLCTVCFDERRTICFVPCGHIAACSACSAQLNECPICRTVITQKIKPLIS